MIKNIAAYAFVRVVDPHALAARMRADAETRALRGTILVAEEGINLFLAGVAESIDDFLAYLRADERFAALQVKVSESADVPFSRLKVKVKPEIIAFRQSDSSPETGRAPEVSAQQLARWIERGADDNGRRLVLLDTRNREEVEYGTFEDAMVLPIDNFTDLPEAVLERRDALSDATVVSFCTGGIRCEKSTNFLLSQGVQDVFHLKGGILQYLEDMPEDQSLWQGECYVFDGRVSVGHGLKPGQNETCGACRRPVTPEGRQHPAYEKGVCCAACRDEYDASDRARFRERQRQMELAAARGELHLGA